MGKFIKGSRPSLHNARITTKPDYLAGYFLAIMHYHYNPSIVKNACDMTPAPKFQADIPSWSLPPIYVVLEACGIQQITEWTGTIPSCNGGSSNYGTTYGSMRSPQPNNELLTTSTLASFESESCTLAPIIESKSNNETNQRLPSLSTANSEQGKEREAVVTIVTPKNEIEEYNITDFCMPGDETYDKEAELYIFVASF